MNSAVDPADPLEVKDMLKSATIYRNSEFNYIYVCYHCECSFTNITDTLNHIESHFDVKVNIVEDTVTELIHETQLYAWDEQIESDLVIKNIDPTILIKYEEEDESEVVEEKYKMCAEDVRTDCNECPLCSAKFNDVSLLVTHTIRDHVKVKKLTCPECSECFHSEIALSTHLQQHIETDEITDDALIDKIMAKCEAVKKEFARQRPLTKYQLKFLKTCDICSLSFTKRTHLISHMKSKHGEGFNCEKCNRSIKGKFNFYAHQYGHLTNVDRVSSLDDEILRENLQKFLDDNVSCDESNSKQPFGCKLCGHLSLSLRNSAELHIMQKHIYFIKPWQYKRFGCEYCDRKFAYSNNLKCHLRTHSKDKPFTCSTCNKSFSQEKYMWNHAKIHSGLKPHQCSTCGNTFRIYQQLIKHCRIHSEQELAKCTICNKAVKVYRLKTHMRDVHENEHRPFECSICSQTFKTSRTLRTHSLRHSGEKKYECRFLCKEKFISNSGRRAHERSRHEAK